MTIILHGRLAVAAFVALLFGINSVSASTQVQFHVDPSSGNDAEADGTAAAPFKTIEAAQLTTRDTFPGGASPALGVTIVLHSGAYDFSATPLTIKSEDSGVSYVNAPGEVPVLSAGVTLDTTAWYTPSDNADLIAYDLTSLVPLEKLGDLKTGGLGGCANSKAEVFVNGLPLWLARYPNVEDTGAFGWNAVNDVCNGTMKPGTTCFDSFQWDNLEKASSWANASNLWMHGYWQYDWADNHIHVTDIDTETGTFYIDPATPPLLGFQRGSRWYAENLIEELDTTNEYYIDVSTGILYLSASIGDLSDVVVSVGDYVAVLASGASDIVMSGMSFAYGKSNLITGIGLTNVTFADCKIFNGGQAGIIVSDSSDFVVKNSVVKNLGCRGISLSGGDRTTLQHGNLRAVGNTVTGYARWKRTYQAGIYFQGVGVHLVGNEISWAPHTGINGIGNECLFEENYLHDLCYEVRDSGAFYVGRSWSERGNIVRNNAFENIVLSPETVHGTNEVSAIYLDDQISGWQITNNTFANCFQGVLIGGGRHNTVESNDFSDCILPIRFDDRGLTWENTSCPPGADYNDDLNSFNYQEDPWASRYPIVVNIFEDMPCTPVHNSIQHNRYCAINGTFGEFYAEADTTNTINDNSRADDCASDDDAYARSIIFRDMSADGRIMKPKVEE